MYDSQRRRRNADLVADRVKQLIGGSPEREFTTGDLLPLARDLGIQAAKPATKIATTLLALYDEGLVERRRTGEGPGHGGYVYRASQELKAALAEFSR